MARRPESVTFEIPQRPAPVEYAIEEPVNMMDLMMAREHPAAFVARIKSIMAHKLAKMIVENSQLFEVPNFAKLNNDRRVRLQFTINDHGRYTNWLPREREEGQREGFTLGYKRAIDKAPYGMEPEQYYE